MNQDDERRIVSFWAAKKTQKLPAAMPSLHRWKDQDRLHYVAMTPGAKEPLDATLERLGLADIMVRSVERICPFLVEGTERHVRLVGQIKDLAERLWLWHEAIRLLRNHGNSPLLKRTMDMSWVMMCKTVLLSKAAGDILTECYYDYPLLPVCLSLNVWETYPYLTMLRDQKRGVIFTHHMGRLGVLSVSQWLTAFREFKRVYVRTGFSPSAAAYAQGLFYQYAHFVQNQHESAQERDRCYDMGSYKVMEPDLPDRLLGSPLNSELIHLHEPELFYLMRHVRACLCYYQAARSWKPVHATERRAALQVMSKFVSAMICDRRMYTTLQGQVRTNFYRRALQPGDNGIYHQTRGLKPSKTDYADAGEVLSNQRHEFYTLLRTFASDTVEVHMKAWVADQEQSMKNEPDDPELALDDPPDPIVDQDIDAMDIDEVPVEPVTPVKERRSRLWDYVSVDRSHRDFVARLIVQSAFDIYTGYACRSRQLEEFDIQRHGFLDDGALPPPLDQPPASPAVALDELMEGRGHQPPFLLFISHMYVVLTPEETWSCQQRGLQWIQAMSIEYNSEANKKKKTLGGRDEDNSRVLSPLILHYLLSYFKNDATITACRSFIDTQVFEGIYNMVIEVGLPDAGHNEQPLFFNNSVFLDALRSFFAEARVYIYVIGAVPLWYYKDPSVWLQKYMNSRSMRDRAALGLPFGVMNATECYIKEVSIGAHGMHRSFQVVPLTEKSHHDVGYTLYNVNLELVDINPDVKEQADLFYDTISQETKQRIDTMTSFPHMAMPRSTFYELATAKERMDIAEASMHEANWNRAHPVVYLISKPPNQLPNPDQMSESMLLGDGSINETRVAERQRISQLIHQQNQHSVQRIKEQVKGDAPPPRRRKRANPYGLTLRQVQKREYGYTDPIEDAFLFDDNVEVAKVDEANVIIDHAMLTKIYGERIFQIMGLPNDVFVSSRALEYRGKQASQATFFSNSMASMMTDPMHIRARMDQHLYEKLFAHVGTAPFDLYHMDKLVDMVMEKDSAVETLMNRVRVVLGKYLSDYMDNSVIYRETPEMILKQVEAMLAAKMDPKKKNKSDVDTMDVDDDEPEEGPELKEVFENIKAALKLVNTLKVSSQGLRYYMISLQAHNPFTQSTARLLFKERDDYVEAMDELKAEMAEEAGNPAPKKKAKKK